MARATDDWAFSYTLDSSVEATICNHGSVYDFRMLFGVYEGDRVTVGSDQDPWGYACATFDLDKEDETIEYVLSSQGWSGIEEYESYYERPALALAQDVGVQKFYAGDLFVRTFPTALEAFEYMRDIGEVSTLTPDLLPTDMAAALPPDLQKGRRNCLSEGALVLSSRAWGDALVAEPREGGCPTFLGVGGYDPEKREYGRVYYQTSDILDAACMWGFGIESAYVIEGVSPEQTAMWVRDFLEKPAPSRKEAREIALRANAICSPGDGDLFDAVARVYAARSRLTAQPEPQQVQQAASRVASGLGNGKNESSRNHVR